MHLHGRNLAAWATLTFRGFANSQEKDAGVAQQAVAGQGVFQ